MKKVDQLRITGTFVTQHEAAAALVHAGDAALVHRSRPRMLLIKCPCGCGDTLVINLDRRAGPAWKLYSRGKALSLFPSYWRDTACESHFILWDNKIYWCDWDDDTIWKRSSDIEERVFGILTYQFIHYEEVADQLQEIPWEVLQACYSLARKGRVEMNLPRRKGEFRRTQLR